MKKAIYTAVLIPFLLSLFPFPVFAQGSHSVTLSPSADATIVSGDGTNYGSDTTLTTQIGENFVMMFDLSSLPANATIDQATLTLTQTDSMGDDITLNAYKVTTSWDETSVSGLTLPSYDSGVSYGALTVDSATGLKTFSQNLSDLVQSWLITPSSNFGLYFSGNAAGSFKHEFGSKESANKPLLAITYFIPDETNPMMSDIKILNISENSAKITWTTDENSTSYVEYGTSDSYGFVAGNDEYVTAHSVDLSGLASETKYYFRVKSKDESGNEAISSGSSFTTVSSGEEVVEEPQEVENGIKPPQNLSVDLKYEDDRSYVELSWEAPTDQAVDQFRIYRSEEDSLSYELLATVGSSELTYRDETVEEDKTYFYVIRTVLGDEESSDSNEEIVTVYSNRVEEELHNFNFWKGFIILNVIGLPIFALWYFVFRKKRKKQKSGRTWKEKALRLRSGQAKGKR